MTKIYKIAVFASGSGTNTENICNYFKDSRNAEVSLILTNKADAPVVDRALRLKVPYLVFNREELNETGIVLDKLVQSEVDLIVLAGFLWLIPQKIIRRFPDRIINIHPALLPKYGGKGMYGNLVHAKVLENKEAESGITIHYVNEKYDEGNIIAQYKCKIVPGETTESLAAKVHELEYRYYPEVIGTVLKHLEG